MGEMWRRYGGDMGRYGEIGGGIEPTTTALCSVFRAPREDEGLRKQRVQRSAVRVRLNPCPLEHWRGEPRVRSFRF